MNGNRTSKQAAEFIIELLNHLSVDKVIVYGISAGGLTAIELAANYPNRARKFCSAGYHIGQYMDAPIRGGSAHAGNRPCTFTTIYNNVAFSKKREKTATLFYHSKLKK